MAGGVDVERFYADVLFELGEHARRGGTAVGAGAVVKRVARLHGLEAAGRLPVPRLTRAERDELHPENLGGPLMPRRNQRRKASPAALLRELLETLEAGAPASTAGRREPGRPLLPKDRTEVQALAQSCYRCGKQGHVWNTCPQTECLICGEYGHVARRCPDGDRGR